jgi:hypothetical protein
MKNKEQVDIRLTDQFLIEIFQNGKVNGRSYQDQVQYLLDQANSKGLNAKLHDLEFLVRSTSHNPHYPIIVVMMGNFLRNDNFKHSEARSKLIVRDLEKLLIKHTKEIQAEKMGMTLEVMNKAKGKGADESKA